MEFHEPTGEELKEAITKAKEAFPAFGKSGKEKANFIDSIADGILNSGIF